MGNTLLEIDNRTVLNLGIDSDSVTYPKTTRRVPKINSVIKRICDGTLKNVLTGQIIMGGDMEFLRKKHFIQDYKPVQTTDTEVNSSSTTINTTDTSELPSSGKGLIGGSVFAYTGKTSTSLTGVSGVEGTHAKGSDIKIPHDLPTNCQKPFNLFRIRPGDGRLIPTDYVDYKFQDAVEQYRTVAGDNSYTTRYIDLNFKDKDQKYRHYYFQKPTSLSLDADETEIPGEYGIELVALIASGEMLRETEKRDQGKQQLTLAYAMLEEFYITYVSQAKQFRKRVKRRKPTRQHVYMRS